MSCCGFKGRTASRGEQRSSCCVGGLRSGCCICVLPCSRNKTRGAYRYGPSAPFCRYALNAASNLRYAAARSRWTARKLSSSSSALPPAWSCCGAACCWAGGLSPGDGRSACGLMTLAAASTAPAAPIFARPALPRRLASHCCCCCCWSFLGSNRRLCCHSATFFCTNSTFLSCRADRAREGFQHTA